MSTLPTGAETYLLRADTVGEWTPPLGQILLALERWHEDNHAGAFAPCREQPCHVIQSIIDDCGHDYEGPEVHA